MASLFSNHPNPEAIQLANEVAGEVYPIIVRRWQADSGTDIDLGIDVTVENVHQSPVCRDWSGTAVLLINDALQGEHPELSVVRREIRARDKEDPEKTHVAHAHVQIIGDGIQPWIIDGTWQQFVHHSVRTEKPELPRVLSADYPTVARTLQESGILGRNHYWNPELDQRDLDRMRHDQVLQIDTPEQILDI